MSTSDSTRLPAGGTPAFKVIETRYRQRLFRSRLEARYAVFFDAMGIKWDYEPEGFDLGFGQLYLPDFFIYRRGEPFGFWVEVKGRTPTADEKRKFHLLCLQTSQKGVMLVGPPGEGELHFCIWPESSTELFRGIWRCGLLRMCASKDVGEKEYMAWLNAAFERALSARFDSRKRARA